jgi:hypothetical protein
MSINTADPRSEDRPAASKQSIIDTDGSAIALERLARALSSAITMRFGRDI